MAPTLPTPIRVAAGIVGSTIDHVRTLPQDLPAIGVSLAGTVFRVSLRVRQEIAVLAVRGDDLLSGLTGAPEEHPAWATFDEDSAAGDARPKSSPSGTEAKADRRAPEAGRQHGAADRKPGPAGRKPGAGGRKHGGSAQGGNRDHRPADRPAAVPAGDPPRGPAEATDHARDRQVRTDRTGPVGLNGHRRTPAKAGTDDRSAAVSTGPDRDAQDSDIPGGDISHSDIPGSDIPGSDIPGSDIPGSDIPGSDIPGSDIPGSDIPGADVGGNDVLELSISLLKERLPDLDEQAVRALLEREESGPARAPYLTLLSNRIVTIEAAGT